MIKEMCVATIGALIEIKARVAVTSTSAAARNVGSVIPMFSSERQPMEATWEVIISDLVTDIVNKFKTLVQSMLYVNLTTKQWEFAEE